MGRQIMFLANLLHPIKKYKRVNSYIVLVITRFYLIKLTALVQKSFTTFNVERTILILRQCFNFTTVWTKFNRDFVHRIVQNSNIFHHKHVDVLHRLDMSLSCVTCMHSSPPPHTTHTHRHHTSVCMYVCKHMCVAYIHLYFVCFLKSELE